MNQVDTAPEFGPWNPGIRSPLPRELLELSTMFRHENVATTIAQAHELGDFCGLPPHETVAIRAERLIIHELLIRVTADLAVSDGPNYEDLGLCFREIVRTILRSYITPHIGEINQLHEELRQTASAQIERELSKEFFASPGPGNDKTERTMSDWLFGWGKSRSAQPSRDESIEERERRILGKWLENSKSAETPLERACFSALVKIVTAIIGKRGRLIGNKELITDLAATVVCNGYGSEQIGEAINPYIRQAVANEGFRFLPAQEKPVVMNVKGASAAGKSTMRPLQRTLAEKINVPWDDFSLISPDIWRKFLLDYDTLGDAFKYAGTLTGHEIEIIDKKLDRYMADKAARGEMSHLLIDRFRFDSFVPETDSDSASKLLTRFGDLVYMFFVITPPDATVERAWGRGLKFGRYKTVDDLLDHNVEAFTGMPQLFFTWALRKTKRVHYEFVDNSVPDGCRPRTVAYGWNGEMNILDIKCMLDIDRYRKININAGKPDDVYVAEKMAPERNVEFLRQCGRLIPVINFADYHTGEIYARLEHGQWVWRDEQRFARAIEDRETRAGLNAIGSIGRAIDNAPVLETTKLDVEKSHTLGAWGERASGN